MQPPREAGRADSWFPAMFRFFRALSVRICGRAGTRNSNTHGQARHKHWTKRRVRWRAHMRAPMQGAAVTAACAPTHARKATTRGGGSTPAAGEPQAGRHAARTESGRAVRLFEASDSFSSFRSEPKSSGSLCGDARRRRGQSAVSGVGAQGLLTRPPEKCESETCVCYTAATRVSAPPFPGFDAARAHLELVRVQNENLEPCEAAERRRQLGEFVLGEHLWKWVGRRIAQRDQRVERSLL